MRLAVTDMADFSPSAPFVAHPQGLIKTYITQPQSQVALEALIISRLVRSANAMWSGITNTAYKDKKMLLFYPHGIGSVPSNSPLRGVLSDTIISIIFNRRIVFFSPFFFLISRYEQIE